MSAGRARGLTVAALLGLLALGAQMLAAGAAGERAVGVRVPHLRTPPRAPAPARGFVNLPRARRGRFSSSRSEPCRRTRRGCRAAVDRSHSRHRGGGRRHRHHLRRRRAAVGRGPALDAPPSAVGPAPSPSPTPSGGGSPASAAAGAQPAGGGAPPAEAPSTGPARVQVLAREYSLTLSRSEVPAGRVTVEFVNGGEDPHNLHLEEATAGTEAGAFPTSVPKTHLDMTVELKPGSYTLFCSLPEHEAKGMKATLTVR